MNNLHRVQNIFISDGTALPANDAAISALTAGKIGVYGTDMKALNPAGGDTISTQPSIYIAESKTDSAGTNYIKRSMKIDWNSVIRYNGEPYRPAIRQVYAIGYSRLLAAGSIEVNNSTNYHFSINFKNDKFNYAARPEQLNVNFTSPLVNTQLITATTIAGTINSSSFRSIVIAVVVGNGTGVYGLTGASAWGVEITAKDIDQFTATTYTANQVYFSVQVDDNSGFGTTTTCTLLQAPNFGSGTYTQIYNIENKDLGYEGVTNRRLWPIPVLDYSSSSTYVLSSAITPTVTGTISEDQVTFSATVAAILRAGEKVELGGVNYEIKYFISSTVAVLTTVLSAGLSAAAAKVRFKYDMVCIEFNDFVHTPTGVVAEANKSVIIAIPAIDTAGAFDSISAAGTDVKDILDAWMATTPGAFAAASI